MEATRSRTLFAKHGRDIPLLPDLRQLRVSVFLPWDLGEVECRTALEFGVVVPIVGWSAEVVTDRG